MALFQWRDEITVKKFTESAFTNFGGNLFLPTTIVQRIVDCAHAGKLTSLEQLKKEVAWRKDWMDEYGKPILEIVRLSHPLHQENPTFS
ncbi:hypothetical protein SCP_0204750 [Sparassis crispa]|uniref:Uncharacterized protein n=1 Tax=Sparassis crispa TaxID=139825 RepID=A0A401GAV0_9APHY|nr:hypothetical protein SCP_0204750 [Sparassis crispa]GBE79277.1 hypothetical protein SCP_0204750 [Sparassis crispa]